MIDSNLCYRLPVEYRTWHDNGKVARSSRTSTTRYAPTSFGPAAAGSRIQLRDFADEHDVSLSVVREAVTRLASEDLVEATPQRGFRVRSLSLEDLRDLTWVRIQIETLALRESIATGDVDWEADVVSAHHRLAGTPTHFEDGTPNVGWMAVHGAYHAALCAAAGSPTLERIRRQLFDASELYRYWSATLPARTVREQRC